MALLLCKDTHYSWKKVFFLAFFYYGVFSLRFFARLSQKKNEMMNIVVSNSSHLKMVSGICAFCYKKPSVLF